MLDIAGPRYGSCDGLGRRSFLRVGSLALGGLTLTELLAARAAPGTPDTSVILFWMWGGPSQFETFDPKMTAPAEIHAVGGEIKTALPGVSFGSSFP